MSTSALEKYKTIPLAQRMHIILLGVEDVQKSASFYDALGWSRAKDSHAGFAKYDLGGFAIALISRKILRKTRVMRAPSDRGFPASP